MLSTAPATKRRHRISKSPRNEHTKLIAAPCTVPLAITATGTTIDPEDIAHRSDCTQGPLSVNDSDTTLMLCNIPNKMTSAQLLAVCDMHSKDTDFFYCPVDDRRNCNLGYAFLNFPQVVSLKKFVEDLESARCRGSESKKVSILLHLYVCGGMLPHACAAHLFNRLFVHSSE